MAEKRARPAEGKVLAARHERPIVGPRGAGLVLALGVVIGVPACQTARVDEGLGNDLAARGLPSIERSEDPRFELPATVSLDDGLDADEAVSIALFNDGAFRRSIGDLELRAADAIQAGLLPNPVIQVYFPVGSKQFEGLIGWALDGLWARPWRVGAAQKAWDAAVHRLVSSAVATRTRVEQAFVTAWLAERRAGFAEARSARLDRLLAIVADRVRRGQVSELERATRAADAALAREDASRARVDAAEARWRLFDAIGADRTIVETGLGEPAKLAAPGEVEVLRDLALETHPEIEAARLEVEAAADQLGWERGHLVRFSALLDANDSSDHGFEIGPGLSLELPIFDRNQAGIARADAQLERAAWDYETRRREVWRTVTRCHDTYRARLEALARWQAEPLEAFRREVELARAAERSGSIAYTDVVTAEIRWIDAQERTAELEAAARLARVELESSIGRRLDARD